MHEFVGRWRITQMEVWSQDIVNLKEEGYFEFNEDYSGQFVFCAVEGKMDVVANTRMPELEFSTQFEGKGIIYIHNGDSSTFTFKRIEEAAPDNVVRFK
ncbi:MAG: hypothetical protein JKY81_09585 [Colwellia sp.]|nr:hypothetical protein [Colwellia sp.]